MPRCADDACGRWRFERLAPKWAAGIRVNGGWYCSRECVERTARAGIDAPPVPSASVTSLPPLRLGVLRHLGAVSDSQLASALESQKVSGRRLGAELRHRGFCSSEAILKALAAQSGARYIAAFDLLRVAQGPVWLPAETVRALGLVPFAVNDATRTVRVACVAPLPRAAMRALLKLTGWTAEPYLIDDDIWEQALRAYRTAGGEPDAKGNTVTVRGAAAAAAHIADAALADRAVTMQLARYDRMTWVRVEGPHHLSDVLVTRMEEDPCLVERIAH